MKFKLWIDRDMDYFPHFHYGKIEDDIQAAYFGHRWFLIIYWLIFELEIWSEIKHEKNQPPTT